MFLKHYIAIPQMVTDPQHPGRTVRTTRLIEDGTTCYSEGGTVYEADANGWVDLPMDVAEKLRSFRNKGSGWFGQAEVADQVRLGTLEQLDQPARPKAAPDAERRGPGRPRRQDVGA